MQADILEMGVEAKENTSNITRCLKLHPIQQRLRHVRYKITGMDENQSSQNKGKLVGR